MSFPAMQLTDAMREAAKDMVRYAYMRDREAHKLTPTGLSAYHDYKQQLLQAAYDANPDYCAFASKPSGRPGYELEYSRLDDEQRELAKAGFNTFLLAVASEAASALKSEGNISKDYNFKSETDYYGMGKPPYQIPHQLVERGRADGSSWVDALGSRKGMAPSKED